MIFSSPEFLLFFALYFALHLVTPPRWRMLLILVGSTAFYGYWDVRLVWLPFLLSFMAYGSGLWIDRRRDGPRAGLRLGLCVAMLLLPLGVAKYTNFIYSDVLGLTVAASEQVWSWPLPLGISFITFTAIAYVVDVHRGVFPVERSLRDLLGYVLFFPQLIAGPILRPRELLPQLEHPRSALRASFLLALTIFTAGLFKKLVFADQIAAAVDPVYDGAGVFSPLDYLLAIYGFTIQIYCDFSGYSDMAIGLGLALGVRLPRNFRRPYVAASVAEFWHRWHLTLSHWLRDYLYIPLGGNRQGLPRQIVNVMITMGLGGLWHGASWTFVMWGLFHGAAIATSHLCRGLRLLLPVPTALRWFVTLHFVVAGWILFRAGDLDTAWRVISGPFTAQGWDAGAFVAANGYYLLVLAAFALSHRFDEHSLMRLAVRRWPRPALLSVIAGLWLLAILVSTGSSAKFIYFDF